MPYSELVEWIEFYRLREAAEKAAAEKNEQAAERARNRRPLR